MSFVVKIVLLYLIYFLTIYQVGCDFRYKIMNKTFFFKKKFIFIFGVLSKIINFASGGGGPSNRDQRAGILLACVPTLSPDFGAI